MIIVSAADERFAPHFAAMLHSAWTKHPNAEYYLIDCGLGDLAKSRLLHFAAKNAIDLVIRPTGNYFDGLPTAKNYPLAVYARLLAPHLIPHARRAIYLDADTVVVGSLSELWQTNMSGHPVAGVYDRHPHLKIRLHDYINSGVLLIDCAAWRDGKITEWCMGHAARYPSRFPDQDAINLTCHGHIHLLPPKWNFTLHEPSHLPNDLRIVHFSGWIKPWLFGDVPFGQLYTHHRNQTPFARLGRLRPYRPWWRHAINMLIGRPKYWRRWLRARKAQSFVDAYIGREKAHGLARKLSDLPHTRKAVAGVPH